MSCSFSKVKRRQCATLAFLEIILRNLSDDVCKVKKTKDCLARIEARKNKLFQQITGHEAGGDFGHVKRNQYGRLLNTVIASFDDLPDNLIALDWVNASVYVLEDQVDEIPAKNAAQRREWGWLLGSLITLYGHFDARLSHTNSMVQGAEIGRKFRKAVA